MVLVNYKLHFLISILCFYQNCKFAKNYLWTISCHVFEINIILASAFLLLSICRKYNWKFLLLYKGFHILLSRLCYYTLYIKFMIQQIWCFRLWRKSGVTEIRSWLLLHRWYIDLKLLYDRSAVSLNSHNLSRFNSLQ